MTDERICPLEPSDILSNRTDLYQKKIDEKKNVKTICFEWSKDNVLIFIKQLNEEIKGHKKN